MVHKKPSGKEERTMEQGFCFLFPLLTKFHIPLYLFISGKISELCEIYLKKINCEIGSNFVK